MSTYYIQNLKKLLYEFKKYIETKDDQSLSIKAFFIISP